MRYAYKIAIKPEPQILSFTKEVKIYKDFLTLNILSEHVKSDENFEIEYTTHYIQLIVYSKRLETPEEVEIRVSNNIKYNENYEKFHEKYTKTSQN